jgi:hypothetical protein
MHGNIRAMAVAVDSFVSRTQHLRMLDVETRGSLYSLGVSLLLSCGSISHRIRNVTDLRIDETFHDGPIQSLATMKRTTY